MPEFQPGDHVVLTDDIRVIGTSHIVTAGTIGRFVRMHERSQLCVVSLPSGEASPFRRHLVMEIFCDPGKLEPVDSPSEAVIWNDADGNGVVLHCQACKEKSMHKPTSLSLTCDCGLSYKTPSELRKAYIVSAAVEAEAER